jgi:hypothetical protein
MKPVSRIDFWLGPMPPRSLSLRGFSVSPLGKCESPIEMDGPILDRDHLRSTSCQQHSIHVTDVNNDRTRLLALDSTTDSRRTDHHLFCCGTPKHILSAHSNGCKVQSSKHYRLYHLFGRSLAISLPPPTVSECIKGD